MDPMTLSPTYRDTERFAAGQVADMQGADDAAPVVAGLALPFDVADDRPGIWITDRGDVHFYDYSTFAPDAFDWQLALPDYGGRVRFLWQHGIEGGIASIPIGGVTELHPDAVGLNFVARFNETDVSRQVQIAVRAGDIREVSTAIRSLDVDIAKQSGLLVRRVTRAELFDVSLVTHAQFPDAKIAEMRALYGRETLPRPVVPAGVGSDADRFLYQLTLACDEVLATFDSLAATLSGRIADDHNDGAIRDQTQRLIEARQRLAELRLATLRTLAR